MKTISFTIFIIILFITSKHIAYSQDNTPTKWTDKVNYEIAPTLSYNFNSNVSPLGLKYYKSFEKSISGTNASIYYNIKNNWHIGVDFDYSSLVGSVDDLKINDTSRFIYLGFLGGRSLKLKDSKWRFNDMYSVGYCLNYTSLDNWENNNTYNVFANALGINLKYTLTYKVFDRASVGFISGTKVYCMFDWFGDNTYIDKNAYFNSLFSMRYNLVITPYIGIVVSSF